MKQDELRRRREEQQVEIRRQKREENISKRRNLAIADGTESDDEGTVDVSSPFITVEICMVFVVDIMMHNRPQSPSSRRVSS